MPYKTCSMCNFVWQDVVQLIEDENVRLNGYQANFPDPKDGYLFLTHETKDCRTTLAIKVQDLKVLHSGPTYTKHNTGSVTCPGKCIEENNFETCTEECDMAWVREIMQCIRTHKVPK